MPIGLGGLAAIQGGSQLAGGLASFFGGGAQRRREEEADQFTKLSRERIEQLFAQFMSERESFDPNQLAEQVQRSINPQLERTASRIIKNQGSLGGVGGKQLFATQKDLLSRPLLAMGERHRGQQSAELQNLLSAYGRFV